MKKLSIIIPAYNEEKRIGSTLGNLILTFGDDVDILVVSNGSKDNTVKVANNWEGGKVKCLEFSEKLGKGGAIIEGLKVVEGDYIGFIDADDAFDLEFVKSQLSKLEVYDCLIASKWKDRNIFQIDEPILRKILSRGWNVLVRVLLGLKFRDTQAGAKFFRKNVKDNLDLNFISTGFAFDAELLCKIKGQGFRINEVNIPSKFVEGSTFSIKHCPRMFSDLVRVWRSK